MNLVFYEHDENPTGDNIEVPNFEGFGWGDLFREDRKLRGLYQSSTWGCRSLASARQ